MKLTREEKAVLVSLLIREDSTLTDMKNSIMAQNQSLNYQKRLNDRIAIVDSLWTKTNNEKAI